MICKPVNDVITCFDESGNVVAVPPAAAAAFVRAQQTAPAAPAPFIATDTELARARLGVCAVCRYFNGTSCSKMSCGCTVAAVAGFTDTQCPEGLWPVVPAPAPRTVDAPQSEEGPK